MATRPAVRKMNARQGGASELGTGDTEHGVEVSRFSRVPSPVSRVPTFVLPPPPESHRGARSEQPIESTDKELISASQQAPENPRWRKRGIQVVAQVLAVARPVARHVVVVKRPGRERHERRNQRRPGCEGSRPSCRKPAPPSPRIEPHDGQQNHGGFLTENSQRSCQREEPELIAEQKQNRQGGEERGGKIQVREGALRKEERRKRQEQRAPGGDFTAGDATPQHIERCDCRRRDQRHRGARRPRRIPEKAPHEAEIDHDQRRVSHRQRGFWNQQPRAIEVQRRRNVIPRFVPEVRQPEQRQVQQEQGGEGREKSQQRL